MISLALEYSLIHISNFLAEKFADYDLNYPQDPNSPFPFKCIQNIIPKSNNAIFTKDFKGKLHFLHWEKDSGANERDTGYSLPSSGDSGSPYWRSDWIPGGERAVLLAIHWGSFELDDIPSFAYDTDARHQCKIIATKVSTIVIEWIRTTLQGIKTLSGQPLEEF